jgi:hypothetical protein
MRASDHSHPGRPQAQRRILSEWNSILKNEDCHSIVAAAVVVVVVVGNFVQSMLS